MYQLKIVINLKGVSKEIPPESFLIPATIEPAQSRGMLRGVKNKKATD